MIDIKKYMRMPFSRCNCAQLAKKIFDELNEPFPNFMEIVKDIKTLKSTEESEVINQFVDKNRMFWSKVDRPIKIPTLVLMKSGRYDEISCDHIGVYIGDNKVIHTTKKTGVYIFTLNSDIYFDKIHESRIEGYYEPKQSDSE